MKKILHATSIGGHPIALQLDTLLGLALSVRGAQPHFLLCDQALRACELAMYTDINAPRQVPHDYKPSGAHCDRCFSTGMARYKAIGAPLHLFSQYLSDSERELSDRVASSASLGDCLSFRDKEGVLIGEQVHAGLVRYFGTSALDREDPDALLTIAREYLRSALCTDFMIRNLIDVVKPDCIVNHHGVYVPQGVIDDVARAKGVRVVVWGTSPRDRTFIFSHGDTYHRTFNSEPNSEWETMEWTSEKEKAITQYLHDRCLGKGDWNWVTDVRGGKSLEVPLLADLGLDPSRPTFCLLTNIGWDAQLYYATNAFPSMVEWLCQTIEHFARTPDLQLVVRIHPFEVKGGNREFAGTIIRERFGVLPENIVIVERDSKLSTYALCHAARAVIIYGTKTGIELAAMGIPVICAADTWVKHKGFTIDTDTPEAYKTALDSLATIEPLSPDQLRRAKMYAYHYFFRKMIPISSIKEGGGFPPELSISSPQDLVPGKDRGLDVCCEGILNEGSFVYEP